MLASLLGLAIAQSLFLLLIKGFVMAMFEGPTASVALSEILSPRIVSWWPDLQAVVFPREHLAYIVPGAILVAGILQGSMTYLFQISQQAIALAFAKTIRDRLFQSLVALPYAKSAAKSPATWMSIIMNDVLFVQMRFSDILTGVLKGGVLIAAGLLFLTIVHWQSAVIVALIAPVVALGMGRTGRSIALYADQYQRHLGNLAAAVLDVRNRFEFIRAHHAEDAEQVHFDRRNLKYYDMIRKSILLRSAFAPGLEFIGVAIFAAFIFATGKGWIAIGREDLIYFFAAMGILLRPLRMFGEQVARGQETLGAMRSSVDLLGNMESRGEPGSRLPSKTLALPDTVTIQNIAVGIDTVVCKGEALRLQRGRSVVIIGPSGAGKSTLAKTLAGLIVPQSYKSDVALDHLTSDVSFVSQEPFLFNGSLRDNLTYGLRQEPTDHELWQALKEVGIEKEWLAQGKDLDASIYAMAGNMSGGQLQRLVIARALLRGKSMYIFDEATSAVDPDQETAIIGSMLQHCRTSKSFFIAITHRLTTVPQFDDVWFLDEGAIRFAGPHEQLMQQPRYRQYVENDA